MKEVNVLTNNDKDFDKEIFVKVRSTGKLLKAKVNLNYSKAKVILLEDEHGILSSVCILFKRQFWR